MSSVTTDIRANLPAEPLYPLRTADELAIAITDPRDKEADPKMLEILAKNHPTSLKVLENISVHPNATILALEHVMDATRKLRHGTLGEKRRMINRLEDATMQRHQKLVHDKAVENAAARFSPFRRM